MKPINPLIKGNVFKVITINREDMPERIYDILVSKTPDMGNDFEGLGQYHIDGLFEYFDEGSEEEQFLIQLTNEDIEYIE